MPDHFEEYLAFFISLLAIVNPASTIPVFVSMTASHSAEERRRIPRSTAVGSGVILLLAYFLGEGLMRFFSIDLADFRIAGGMLILTMAFSMLRGEVGSTKQTEEEEHEAPAREHVAIVPLAIPLCAGPGSISVMIIAAAESEGWISHLVAGGSIVAVAGVLFLTLRAASRIARVLGKTGLNVFSRLMGLILAAIAVHHIIAGLSEAFPGLLKGGGG